MDEIEKIKYHLSLLAESLDSREHPMPTLVISLDWSRDDLNAAHDIFQEFDERIDADEQINWREFESVFNEKLGISYQALKSIVLAFFRNHQWVDVCAAYALAFPCAEFYEINNNAAETYEQSVANVIGSTGITWQRNFRLPIGVNHFTEVDFFFSLRGKRVVVEAKISVDTREASNLLSKWDTIHGKNAADKLIVVTRDCSLSAREILGKRDVLVMSRAEIREYITQ